MLTSETRVLKHFGAFRKMSRVQLLARYVLNRSTLFTANNRIIDKVQLSTGTNDSTSDDDENKVKEKSEEKKNSQEALDKLNKLLLSMTGEDFASQKKKLDLAKPDNKRLKNREDKATAKVEPPEVQIANAAKIVAESIGGDTKQTQSELLMKLLSVTQGDASTTKLKDLVKGMKVEQESATAAVQSKAQQVKRVLQSRTSEINRDIDRSRVKTVKPSKLELSTEKIDLFGSEPLGIFTAEQSDGTEGVENKTWNQLYQKDLKLAVTHPPSNYFQQMILWTEQGKVWKFPIDNEQGLEEEKKVYFAEHVFLDKHLEPWCPSSGPLRHFMELVCVGLSKNPYLTVEAKKENILWFRDYFEKKKQLLMETGAIQGQDAQKSNQKQIE